MLKPALGVHFIIGTHIENTVQVFHRILDLKHGPDVYPGLVVYGNSYHASASPSPVNTCNSEPSVDGKESPSGSARSRCG